MKTKRVRDNIKPWFLAVIILFLIIVILFLHFFATSREKEQTEVEEKIIMVVQGYAADVEQKLNGIQKGLEAMSSYMKKVQKEDIDNDAVITTICETIGVYDAVICEPDGTGVGRDGASVDLSGVPYFEKAFTEENKMFYVDDDGLSERSAIVIVSPVVYQDYATSYLVCYCEPSILETLVKRVDFGTSAFYMLMDSSGQVIAVSGNTGNVLCLRSPDYFSFLKEMEGNQRNAERMYTRIQNSNSDISLFETQGENRYLAYVPVGVGRFYLIAGISESYVDMAVKAEWSISSSMMWRLGIVFFVFAAIVSVLNIMSRKKEREKNRQLADKADTDLLTDLYNKVATERKIKEYIAEHPDERGLMFVLDIDNFKKINDTMGHAFGDEVLRTLGLRIRGEFRSSDIVGRTGGDEFTIFLCNMKNESIIKSEAQRVERFFQNFQAGEYVKYSATASIGAAVFPTDAKNFEGLYKAADKALYVAKKRGKNQLAFYGED